MRDPDLVILRECDAVVARRDYGLVAFGDELRRLARCPEWSDPDLDLRLHRGVGRIRLRLRLPVCIVIAAANVDDVLAIARDREIRELLAIVGAIVGDLPRLEVRSFCRPDVADTAHVEHPRDARSASRGRELLRVRIAEYLVERERLRRGSASDRRRGNRVRRLRRARGLCGEPSAERDQRRRRREMLRAGEARQATACPLRGDRGQHGDPCHSECEWPEATGERIETTWRTTSAMLRSRTARGLARREPSPLSRPCACRDRW